MRVVRMSSVATSTGEELAQQHSDLARSGQEELAQHFGSALDGFPVDVEVRHQADAARADLADQHALRLGSLGDHRRGHVVQHDHVRLHGRRVHAEQHATHP